MPRLLLSISLLTVAVLVGGCGGSSGANGAAGSDSGLTSAGCASDKTAQPFTVGMHQAAVSGVTVAIEANPPVPTLNEQNTWKLTVTDKSGAPVPSGTLVSMICKMTHASGAGHGCTSTIQVKEMAEGVYEAKPIVFNMQGHWVVTFQVGGTDEVPFQLCVE
jgi:hypothetical protein